jgi:dihydropteroate synthase
MGVLNVTPDSFSDGGRYLDADAAVAHGLQLARDAADIIDVGGEATNPRATPTTTEVELARVLPVVARLAAAGVADSIDTTKASVARAAVGAGARYVNDISGGLFDPEMASALADLDVTYIAGHVRGRSIAEVFADERAITWQDVAAELTERLAALPPAARARAWVDPGIGFGKGDDAGTNLALLRHAGDIARTVGAPVVVGPSRKRFLRRLLPEAAGEVELDVASVAACLAALAAGAKVFRVHNVTLLRAAFTVYTKL